jgi:serine phosphatase RsbU (regulator of sigma subunit)
MAELRHALRAFADEGHDGVTILQRLNSLMRRYHDDQSATMCLMTLDPRTGAVHIASSGHIPPLFVQEGKAWFGAGGGVLLGFPSTDVGLQETILPPGAAVVLITDGLIEDRNVALGDNLERLRLMQFDTDLERYSDHVLAEFGHREDDVAMIVVCRLAETQPPRS